MVEAYGQELAGVKSLFASEDFLRLILESPSFPMEKKSAVLTELGDSMSLSDGMKRFLGLLLAKGRLKYLPQIEAQYKGFADELSGVLRAHIVSASKLNQTQKKAIGAGLEEKTGKKIELTVSVDASLIGGLQANVGGKIFDGSIRTQLKRIEDTLKKG
ncbi:ATP synthase F1 subunit delta [Trichloromonas sp.]|uniref:ATP synthase F1 subunit delta n=1 Tax=Trichloromonas sp. TaxID=3069249 RepID=UPI003D819521